MFDKKTYYNPGKIISRLKQQLVKYEKMLGESEERLAELQMQQMDTALATDYEKLTELEQAIAAEQSNQESILYRLEETETELDEMPESIPADPNVRNYSYTVVDYQVYYRVNSLMNQVKMPAATAERVKGMVAIRDTVRELITMQMEESVTDEEIWKQQEKLNQVYDTYTAKYGVIGSNANKRAFSDDSYYGLQSSLEEKNEDGTMKRNADKITKRTI